MTSPTLTFLMLAADLDLDTLIIVADALRTTARNYPGLRMERPYTTSIELDEAVRHWQGMAGASRARAAFEESCDGVESPQETPLRCLFTRNGMRPEVNGEIWDGDVLLARGDLVFRAEKVVVEFDGDIHRTDRAQWQRDVDRNERLRAAGWLVIHVTHDMLVNNPNTILTRVSAALATR